MGLFAKVLLGISILFFLFTISGFLLPAEYSVSRSIQIAAPTTQIYPHLNNLKSWPEWTVWNTRADSTLVFQYGLQTEGEGATQQWKGEKMGDGSLKIVKSYPKEGIEYELSMNEGQMRSIGKVQMQIIDSTQTKVTWLMEGSWGNNPVRRYFGLLLEKWLAPDFEKNLSNLKQRAEQ